MRKLIMLAALALPAAVTAATFDFTALGGNNTLLAIPNNTTASRRRDSSNLNTAGGAVAAQRDRTTMGLASARKATACLDGAGDVNELDNAGAPEAICSSARTIPLDQPWVSSLDSGGSGGSEEGQPRLGEQHRRAAAGAERISSSSAWRLRRRGRRRHPVALVAAGFDPDALLCDVHAPERCRRPTTTTWSGAAPMTKARFLVPEPGTLGLLGVALVFGAMRRRARH